MALDQANDTSLEDFVAARYQKTKYILSVCSGAVTLAKAGVLKNKKATTTKALWWWVTTFGKGVKWVPSARWVVDGKVWTSSGVSSGEYNFCPKLPQKEEGRFVMLIYFRRHGYDYRLLTAFIRGGEDQSGGK